MKSPCKFVLVALLLLCAALPGCNRDSEAQQLAAARQYLASKDLAAALVSIKSALEVRPDSGPLRFLHGQALLEGGEPSAARMELTKARQLGQADNDVLPSLARAMVFDGKATEAIQAFATIRLADPRAQSSLLLTLAVAHDLSGHAEQARQAVDAALLADPESADANVAVAAAMAARSDLDGALARIDQVLQREPQSANALHLKGLLLRHGRSDANGAIAAQRQALAADPRHVRAHTEVLNLLRQARDMPALRLQLAEMRKALPKNLNTLLFRAQAEAIDGKLDVAREIVQQLLKSTAPDPRVLMLSAEIEMRLGNLAQAQTQLNRALAASPGLTQARHLLAALHLRQGQPVKALGALQTLVRPHSRDASALALAAQAWLASGKFSLAQEYFERALRVDPNNSRLKTAQILSRLAQGQGDEGLALVEETAMAEQGAFADLALVSAHLRRKDLDAALRVTDRLQGKYPEKAMLHLLRGQIHALRHDDAKARESLEQALKIDPSHAPAGLELAALDLATKRYVLARARLQGLLESQPGNHRAWLTMAAVNQAEAKPATVTTALLQSALKHNPTEPTLRVALADHLLGAGAVHEALAATQEGLAALPENPALLDAAVKVHLTAGQPAQAGVLLRRLADLQPGSASVHLRLADLYVSQRDWSAADTSLSKALEIDPGMQAAERRRVQVKLQHQPIAESLKVARQVQQRQPGGAEGYLLEGHVHSHAKDWPAGSKAFRSALERAGSSEAAIGLHAALHAGKRSAEAQRHALTWRQVRPQDGLFVAYLGTVAISNHQWAQAEAHFREAVSLLPSDAAINNNLAWVLLEQGKSGALPYAQAANLLRPNSPVLMDTLANALAAEGKLTQALALLDQALQIDPSYQQARLSLAKVAGARQQTN